MRDEFEVSNVESMVFLLETGSSPMTSQCVMVLTVLVASVALVSHSVEAVEFEIT